MSDTPSKTVATTLSGGDFGGQIVDWPVGAATHDIIDDVGTTWTYVLHEDAVLAVLHAVTPKSD